MLSMTTELNLIKLFSALKAKLGGYPMVIGDSWDESKFSYESASAQMRKMISKNIAFRSNVFLDEKNTQRNVIYVSFNLKGQFTPRI